MTNNYHYGALRPASGYMENNSTLSVQDGQVPQ